MGNLLYLVHRLPYPPNKGDKVRSYHWLRHLSARHRVFLGTLVDDPADEVYIDKVRAMCPDLYVARLHPGVAKLRSLSGWWTQQALSLPYYRDDGLQAWVSQTLATQKIDAAVVFSSVMAQYLEAWPGIAAPPLLVDFVDVDSLKWSQYAARHRWPLSWLYRREGEQLLVHERALVARAQRSFFVTEHETAMFCQLAPECAGRVETMNNGVDADYFSPAPERASPFGADGGAPMPLVFTGAMDYWPNVDAVTWFVRDILPALQQRWPQLRFFIVGRNPLPAVQALASDRVVVTGTVPDVRPYLQHAALVVAPLRVARGLQNKVLEAMAMGRAVVASQSCAQAIDARSGEELISAGTGDDFVREVDALLRAPARAAAMGQAGRLRVLSRYSWAAHLAQIDRHLDARPVPRGGA